MCKFDAESFCYLLILRTHSSACVKYARRSINTLMVSLYSLNNAFKDYYTQIDHRARDFGKKKFRCLFFFWQEWNRVPAWMPAMDIIGLIFLSHLFNEIIITSYYGTINAYFYVQ
ncbi:hypothetical protein DI53_3567 [Sphingobacterium deserti]|uniref:Uncharacterized protein n=1 Tax=Sphingobacterium deserti TaxID=1229276 RepID=A0A0B8SYQ7_9SPHI|nr:hypothetical protein DI53_3567 [Sphingobacterium deserti]